MSGEFQRVKIGDKELPLPRWSFHAIAVVLLLGAVGYGAHWAYGKINESRTAIGPAERFQLEESSRHFAEDAAAEFTAFDDARGQLKLRFYGSDGCIATLRRSGTNGPRQVQWLGDPAQAAPPPEVALVLDGLVTSPAFAGGPPRCACHFQGDFREWLGERSGEWVRIYREYAHGCRMFWHRNMARGFDEVDANGNRVIHFDRCAH